MTTTAPRSPSRLGLPVLVGGFVAFAVLGGSQALYGPSVPGFQRAFGVDVAAAGLGLPVHATASFVGVALWGVLERWRLAAGAVLAGSAGLLAGGAAGVAVATTLPLALAAVAVVGLGFGCLMTGVNTLVARDPRPNSVGLLNALHAMFGLGAVALPVVLSVGGFRSGFVVVAAGAAAVLVPLRTARDPAPELDPRAPGGDAARPPARTRLVASFALLYVTYVGVEAGLANWMASHLTDLRWSEAAAARWTAAFWFTFTVGRFLVAPIATRTPPGRLVRIAMGLAAVTLVVAHLDAAAPWAFVAAGLVLAPVFPTGLVWLARAVPEVRGGTAYMMMAGSLGAAALPAAVGLVAGSLGIQIVPTVLLGLAGVAVLVARSLPDVPSDRRRTAPGPGSSDGGTVGSPPERRPIPPGNGDAPSSHGAHTTSRSPHDPADRLPGSRSSTRHPHRP